ncbi:methylated-DNA--[protein]-cysteine S-methyltransferase [Candidatus Palauibacter soopunensis]|uniref:methylated-DNA--[protein]-cysteine S-methyltransferase n=1 Tax=Candidatus Palauibacter soopunensis TaxID=3056739 RepID=UPI002389ECF0|nr:methylated-DNA--[protein]-cysteine S-methyltransferase [Candidatus Palauibacter soopunensis]MDE2879960.1 methylated-DNA--[protein]-cysteine S-methyltransferase [Candidatus Palauibacter soopunensis]
MTRRCTTCREEDVLAWILGDPDADAAQKLAERMAACPVCRERAVEYRLLERSAKALRDGPAIRWRRFDSPFGVMRIAASAAGLAALSWQDESDDAFVDGLEHRYGSTPVVSDTDRLASAEEQLTEYFGRRRLRFDLFVDLTELGDFPRAVLGAASGLDFGETVTYTEIARRIGRPKASRAVGNALGRNPVPIIVPCHRVVRTDRTLGGYTGGLRYKRALLDIEGRTDLLGSHGQTEMPLA